MNYTEVRREIGRRLGDPDLKKYRGLVSQCFVSSMCQLLENEENYNLEEISGLIIDEPEVLIFSGGEQHIITLKDDAIKLLDVFQDVSTPLQTAITFIEITRTDFKRMSLERAFRPTVNEVFWFRRANKVHFIRGKEENVNLVGVNDIILQYLINPDPTQWQDTTNLITGENFSRNFIYKTIGKTVENISTYPAFNVGKT